MRVRQLLLVGGVLALGCCGCVSRYRMARNLAELRAEHAAADAVLTARIRQLEDELHDVSEQFVDVTIDEAQTRADEDDRLSDQVTRIERGLMAKIGAESIARTGEVEHLHARLVDVAVTLDETIRRESLLLSEGVERLDGAVAHLERAVAGGISDESRAREAGDAGLHKALADVEGRVTARIAADAEAQVAGRDNLHAVVVELQREWASRAAAESQVRSDDYACLLEALQDHQAEVNVHLAQLEGRVGALSTDLAARIEATAVVTPQVRSVQAPPVQEPRAEPVDEFGPARFEPEAAAEPATADAAP